MYRDLFFLIPPVVSKAFQLLGSSSHFIVLDVFLKSRDDDAIKSPRN
jgi:hypothetical protein